MLCKNNKITIIISFIAEITKVDRKVIRIITRPTKSDVKFIKSGEKFINSNRNK